MLVSREALQYARWVLTTLDIEDFCRQTLRVSPSASTKTCNTAHEQWSKLLVRGSYRDHVGYFSEGYNSLFCKNFDHGSHPYCMWSRGDFEILLPEPHAGYQPQPVPMPTLTKAESVLDLKTWLVTTHNVTSYAQPLRGPGLPILHSNPHVSYGQSLRRQKDLDPI